MSTRVFWFLFPLIILGLTHTTDVGAQIIANLQVSEFSFSPDGDGIEESTDISYTLLDTAAVYVLILEKDSTTVIDTLQGGVTQFPLPAPPPLTWDGTNSGGVLVPEDRYLVFVRAVGAAESDSAYVTVAVDVTPPQVSITNVFPTFFSPGAGDSMLTVEYDVSDAPPSTSVRVVVDMFDPSGSVIETLRDSLVQANGSYSDTWDASTATSDGFYQTRVRVEDQAGHEAVDFFSLIDVDLDEPTISVTSLEPSSTLRLDELPDSLFGWAWDRHGIDSLFVRYRQADPFTTVASTVLLRDTLFFSVQLFETLTEDSTYSLGFRAVDGAGRDDLLTFAITLDTTAPLAPILVTPANAVVRTPVFPLDATIADNDLELQMQIFRNGVLLATILPNTPGASVLPYAVDLLPGENRLTAKLIDAAGNESPLSNELVIVFDNSAGLRLPQPFRSNDVFQVNLSRSAATTTLRIYDLGGNLVDILRSTTVSTGITLTWDGRNGDGDAVKKGPLVAVVEVRYADGGSDVFREVFLFQP